MIGPSVWDNEAYRGVEKASELYPSKIYVEKIWSEADNE
jgi:hypothetical protein